MKKIIVALAATFTLGAFSFAEGYINANDLEKGTITETRQEEDGFVLVATPEKSLEVGKSDTYTVGDETFTQRISTKGSGSVAQRERIITFPAKAGETVTIICHSSGSAGQRPLHLANVDTKKDVKVISAGSYKEGGPTVDSTKITADGTYGVYSKGGGVYIYKIEIKK